MRALTPTVLAILALLLSSAAVAQSAKPAGESSSMSTTTPAANVDDESFNSYQRVTDGMKPPKATKSPDPDYPANSPRRRTQWSGRYVGWNQSRRAMSNWCTCCGHPMTHSRTPQSPPSRLGNFLRRKRTVGPSRYKSPSKCISRNKAGSDPVKNALLRCYNFASKSLGPVEVDG